MAESVALSGAPGWSENSPLGLEGFALTADSGGSAGAAPVGFGEMSLQESGGSSKTPRQGHGFRVPCATGEVLGRWGWGPCSTEGGVL